jgi:transposase
LAAFVTFARGIRSDQAAVKAAFSLPWSNGPTEGHVNRLKFIKRQGYGRAGFELLKRRVLPLLL